VSERIGFVGLGVMGRPMARNLLAAGYPLVVHSRSAPPVDDLVASGATRGQSPADVASRTDVVITMLPDTPDVEQVVLGPEGIASASAASLLVDMSTIEPGATRRIAEALAGTGIRMVDAPVSGGERGAIDGTLSIMIGGDESDVARARPMFEVLGSTIVHVGAIGAGQVCKACNQLVVAATIEAVAEALTLAKRSGVDAAKVREALLGGFAGSKVLDVHGQRMLDGAFEPGFRARLHAKDARIVHSAARDVGASTPSFDAVAEQLDRLVERGGGELDHAALVTLLEEDKAGRRSGRQTQLPVPESVNVFPASGTNLQS
jgi:2-hydroxy-3-oxopropionate reductase